jgi:hypothetical protein
MQKEPETGLGILKGQDALHTKTKKGKMGTGLTGIYRHWYNIMKLGKEDKGLGRLKDRIGPWGRHV